MKKQPHHYPVAVEFEGNVYEATRLRAFSTKYVVAFMFSWRMEQSLIRGLAMFPLYHRDMMHG